MKEENRKKAYAERPGRRQRFTIVKYISLNVTPLTGTAP
jgi:hypothetical protein